MTLTLYNPSIITGTYYGTKQGSGGDNNGGGPVGTADPFEGTWIGPNGNIIITASNGNWTQSLDYQVMGISFALIEYIHGTYTFSGNAVTVTVDEVNKAIFFYTSEGGSGTTEWVSYDALTSSQQSRIGGKTTTATVTGDTFTSQTQDGTALYTRTDK
jgi:hypothetical protein